MFQKESAVNKTYDYFYSIHKAYILISCNLETLEKIDTRGFLYICIDK